jgi:hypothetical protein
MAFAVLVCVAMLVTVIPTGVRATLSSEQTFISEGAEESTFALWNAEWERFDANTANDYDMWCRTMHEVHGGTHGIYCSKNGYNSHYYANGTQAEDVNITSSSDLTQKSHILRYDTGMDAIMRKQLDSHARYYGTVTVTFWFYSDTGASDAKQPGSGETVGYDFLNLIYYTGTGDSRVKHVAWTDTEEEATAKTWAQKSVVIPSNSTWVGFEFVSGTVAPEGGDASSPASFIDMRNGGMKEGVFVDDITVVGTDRLPAEDLATAVDQLPAYQKSLTFNVNWTNNDPQVGMKWIDLYYRIDGTGNWIKYETSLRPDGKFPNTTATIAFTAPREGTYEFFTRGTDNLDVIEPARNVADATTTIDLSAPTSTIKFSGDGDGTNYKGTFSFTLSAADSVSGISTIHYRLNSGSWIEYSSGVGIARNGTWTIDYYATDLAGNDETVKSSTIVLKDAAPGINIDDPVIASNGDAVVNFTIALNGTTVTDLQYSLDDGDFVSIDVNDRSVTFTGLAEGDHSLTIKATDSNGNVLKETKTFSIKSGGLDSIMSNPLVLIGIVAAVVAAVAVVFLLVRRKK